MMDKVRSCMEQLIEEGFGPYPVLQLGIVLTLHVICV